MVSTSPAAIAPSTASASSFITATSYPFEAKSLEAIPIEEPETTSDSTKSHSDMTAEPSLSPPSLATSDQSVDISTSVGILDTEGKGRPSVYLFIFVNPLSGDQKGVDLVQLPIQHFRLRRLPQVQVEIHNILDDKDRGKGVEKIMLIESLVKQGKLPSIRPSDSHTDASSMPKGKLSDTAATRQIHVWSAGGDGTVMSVFELLVAHKIDLDLVFFSCIPFGTGNDFSQVLGWGRTVSKKDILGPRLHHLEELVTERLEKSDAARLDIWQMEMTAHPSGHVRQAGVKNRRDGHDVAEVKEPNNKEPTQRLVRKMCNYVSIGVQGYVGSGFEKHRAGKRLSNILVYTNESSKWVFWRKFPPVTEFIASITQRGQPVLRCPLPPGSMRTSSEAQETDRIPELTKHPIDLVIQNIPHIWGREVDLWGEAVSGLEVVRHRSGPTDPQEWKPQRANDGRLEIMVIGNMMSYIKKLVNIRSHVSRIGQLSTPFAVHFRRPPSLPTRHTSSLWSFLKNKLASLRRNAYERSNIICIMCDGEFYELKDPATVEFKRFAQIWTLCRNDDQNQSRLVLDEHDTSTPH